MPKPIEFHFDFSSPYSYLASEQIEPIAARHGRTVEYKPVLLGAVFKLAKSAPLTEQYSPKAKYAVRDFARSAHRQSVPSVQSRAPRTSLSGCTARSAARSWRA